MPQAAQEDKKLGSGSPRLPLSPLLPKLTVDLSLCSTSGTPPKTPGTCTVIAGLDTYTTRSLISLNVFHRLTGAVLSSSEGSCLNFVDGTSTAILGTTTLLVSHQAVHVTVCFLVVRTVNHVLGADILLGTDYMSSRGHRVILDFKPDRPIVTHFISAAVNSNQGSPETINGGDFSLRRSPDGTWELTWQWEETPPEGLFKGTYIYGRKLKNQEQVEWFNTEVQRWIRSKFLIPFDPKISGAEKCILTWNPVVQTHKSTKVRPTLDYSILNPYIKNNNSVSQSEVCHESLRKWRKCTSAYLVDVEKAYMNVMVSQNHHPYQVAYVGSKPYIMTRMGFGLSIAPRVLKCLISYILIQASLERVTNPYRDDILVEDWDDVQRVRDILLSHGLPTKPPVNLFDFSKGPTRALGLELFKEADEIYWRRRSDSNWRLTKVNPTCREVAAFIGRACPASYPVMGYLRPMALNILSQIGREAHRSGWSSTASPRVAEKCLEVQQYITSSDPVKGQWRIPVTSEWALATDASGQALGCCVLTQSAWAASPNAGCIVIEDHCWLVKNVETHINVSELDAVIRGFKIIIGYLKQGDTVTIVIDNSVVSDWLKSTVNDGKIEVNGLYEILVRRRLNIIREIVEPYVINVKWVASHLNPADKLTRTPTGWVETPVSAAAIEETNQTGLPFQKIREAQLSDEETRQCVSKLDQQNLLVIRDEIAFKKLQLGREIVLQVILPSQLVEEMIQHVHIELGHAGWKCTWYETKKRFHVAGKTPLARRVQEVLRECNNCAVKNAKINRNVEERHSLRLKPWEEVFVDTLQLGSAVDAHPHSAVMFIDNYSKYCEAFILNTKTAEEICFHTESIISRYGRIGILRLDNGREFDNNAMRSLANRYGVQLAYGSVRNPQSQSTVERLHSTLLGILRALLFGTNNHSTSEFHRALSIYRSRPHSSLGNRSPREVLFGEPNGPTPDNFNAENYQADAFDDIDRREAQYEQTQLQVAPQFDCGERVLVRVDDRRRVKLQYPWTEGTVERVLGNGAYLVRDRQGRQAMFNEKSLAKCAVPFLTEKFQNEISRQRTEEIIAQSDEEFLTPQPAPHSPAPSDGQHDSVSSLAAISAPAESRTTDPAPMQTPPARTSKRTKKPVRRLIEEL